MLASDGVNSLMYGIVVPALFFVATVVEIFEALMFLFDS